MSYVNFISITQNISRFPHCYFVWPHLKDWLTPLSLVKSWITNPKITVMGKCTAPSCCPLCALILQFPPAEHAHSAVLSKLPVFPAGPQILPRTSLGIPPENTPSPRAWTRRALPTCTCSIAVLMGIITGVFPIPSSSFDLLCCQQMRSPCFHYQLCHGLSVTTLASKISANTDISFIPPVCVSAKSLTARLCRLYLGVFALGHLLTEMSNNVEAE